MLTVNLKHSQWVSERAEIIGHPQFRKKVENIYRKHIFNKFQQYLSIYLLRFFYVCLHLVYSVSCVVSVPVSVWKCGGQSSPPKRASASSMLNSTHAQ